MWKLQGLKWSLGESMDLPVRELRKLQGLWTLEVFSRILLSGTSEIVELTENMGLRIGSLGFYFCVCFYIIITFQLRTLNNTLSVPVYDLEDKFNYMS